MDPRIFEGSFVIVIIRGVASTNNLGQLLAVKN